jgi:polyphosphate kinase
VYGFLELKTHAKLSMVVRREGGNLTTYVHTGTGNYHPVTARIYTDLSYFTSDPIIGRDAARVFNYITGYAEPSDIERMAVSPLTLRKRIIEHIKGETNHSRHGKPGVIWMKMNSLVDPDVIDALYEASQAGVTIELVVRGICCLRPGIRGVSDNIRVISIVGRFLEHSRIFYFANDGKEELYFGSADWMPRNFDRRVEVVAGVHEKRLTDRLCSLLEVSLADNRNAWDLSPEGAYTQRKPGPRPVIASQEIFLSNSWGQVQLPTASSNGDSADHGVPATEELQSAAPTSSS